MGALGVGLAGVGGFKEWSPAMRALYGLAVFATGVPGAVAAAEGQAKKDLRRIGGELRQSRYAARSARTDAEGARREAGFLGWG